MTLGEHPRAVPHSKKGPLPCDTKRRVNPPWLWPWTWPWLTLVLALALAVALDLALALALALVNLQGSETLQGGTTPPHHRRSQD